MIGFSIIGMVVNVVLFLTGVIGVESLILVTLILSWLALTFSAYGNVISAQVNKKVEKIDADTVQADEVNAEELTVKKKRKHHISSDGFER